MLKELMEAFKNNLITVCQITWRLFLILCGVVLFLVTIGCLVESVPIVRYTGIILAITVVVTLICDYPDIKRKHKK